MISMKKTENEDIKTGGSTETKSSGAMKKVKYGSMSLITIAIVIAIVIVVNIMASLMEKRRPMKLDLTADNRYDLSDETIDVLKNLDEDVEILITMPRTDFDAMAEQANYSYQLYFRMYYGIEPEPLDFPYEMIPIILDKYEMYSKQGDGKGEVKVKYVNLSTDPDAISKYTKYYNGEITKNSMVFYSGENVKVLTESDINNMITADAAAAQNQSVSLVFAGESIITSQIMNVTDSHIVKVAFADKMNGSNIYREDYSEVVSTLKDELLAKNGYDCTEIDIAKDELDTELYDMVVIPMPQNDFSDAVIDSLGDFMYNSENYGKNMLYIPDLAATNLTNIDEFLADWSIQVEPWILGDPQAMGSNPTSIVLSIADEESVGAIPNDSLPIVAPYSREISILSKNNQCVTTAVLKSSSMSAPYSALSDDAAPSTDMGERNVVVKSTKEHGVQFDVFRSNLLVVGSSMFTDKELIVQSSTYNNANVLLNILNTMTGKETGVVIPEKALQHAVIAPTAKQSNGIVTILVAIPVIVALIGIVVLIRRKNR